jgi:pimeloyl-ACP methyl ester carboxylesterase
MRGDTFMSTEGNATSQGQYAQANGLEIYYEEYGSGEPLLLPHGGTLTAHSWQAHAPLFAQHFRVIAPDSRGHGRTRNPSGELSYRLMADDMAAFVQALGLNKSLLCGYSDGGQIALEFGMHYPDLAKALVVCGAWYKFSEGYCNGLKGWGLEGPGVVDMVKLQTNMAGAVEFWQTEHAPLGGPDAWQTLLRSIATMWWTPLNYTATDFEKITSPTLILLGDRDEFIPVEEAVEMYRFIPQAELAILPNANHGETVSGSSGVNPLFLNTVLDFLLRQYAQNAQPEEH